jgi:hypothetical protein
MTAEPRRLVAAELAPLVAAAPLTAGYRFELLERRDVPALIGALWGWYRDISIGAASCYFAADYYLRKVWFADADERDCIVLGLKRGTDIVGMFSCRLERAARSIYASVGVAASEHRGANVAHAGIVFVEALGHHLGMGFVHGMATLKHPYAQRAFERAGWQLIGITPGYDRELVAPGVVKRVYEAVYGKTLQSDCLLEPHPNNLTPRTQRLFSSLFSNHDQMADATDPP